MAGAFTIPAPGGDPVSDEVRQILHARSMLRQLDNEVLRTEVRLRRLPALAAASGGGSGSGGGSRPNSAERLAARRGPFKMSRNKLDIGLAEIGPKGVGLNVGYMRGMGGQLLTAGIGFHVAAGIGNQAMNIADKQRKLEEAGFNAVERRSQAGLDVVGGAASTVGAVTGVTPAAAMLLRAGGLSEDDVKRRMSDAYNLIFDPSTRRLQVRRMTAAYKQAADEVTKQYRDANDFLDTWTPSDFDVADDAGRAQLRHELRQKNRKYVDAFFDAKYHDATYRAAQDARGD